MLKRFCAFQLLWWGGELTGSCVVGWWGTCALKFQVTSSRCQGVLEGPLPFQQDLAGCRLVPGWKIIYLPFVLFCFLKKKTAKASWKQELNQWAGKNSVMEKGSLCLFLNLAFKEPGYSWARRYIMCRLGWELSLELLWMSRRPCIVAADGGATSHCLCPLICTRGWPVPSPRPRHTSMGLHISLFSTNKWGCGSWERAGPQSGSHTVFSLDSELSCFVYLFVFSNWPLGKKNALVICGFHALCLLCSTPWVGYLIFVAYVKSLSGPYRRV